MPCSFYPIKQSSDTNIERLSEGLFQGQFIYIKNTALCQSTVYCCLQPILAGSIQAQFSISSVYFFLQTYYNTPLPVLLKLREILWGVKALIPVRHTGLSALDPTPHSRNVRCKSSNFYTADLHLNNVPMELRILVNNICVCMTVCVW